MASSNETPRAPLHALIDADQRSLLERVATRNDRTLSAEIGRAVAAHLEGRLLGVQDPGTNSPETAVVSEEP